MATTIFKNLQEIAEYVQKRMGYDIVPEVSKDDKGSHLLLIFPNELNWERFLLVSKITWHEQPDNLNEYWGIKIGDNLWGYSQQSGTGNDDTWVRLWDYPNSHAISFEGQ